MNIEIIRVRIRVDDDKKLINKEISKYITDKVIQPIVVHWVAKISIAW